MYKFKGNMLNRKQWLNVSRVFLSIYLSLILRRVRSKMTSYSKTATTIYLYDVPRSIAEDPRIASLRPVQKSAPGLEADILKKTKTKVASIELSKQTLSLGNH